MTTISLRGIEKSFSDTRVLTDCNLEIHDHEFLVLVGPSGSGKTTLLRIVAGLEMPTSGDVCFDGVPVNHIDVGDRDVAMVFQNYGLYPHMSVYDNMSLGLLKRGVPKREARERVEAAAGMLQIQSLLRRRPRQLSGGQRQRVALGRSIVRDPKVFLLDEPLSNLDAHLRIQMRAEILRVHRSVTATALYVTHDQVEAMTMGDRVAVMQHGVIQQVGPPDELYDRPVNRFVGGFIGTPAMGFIRGVLRDDDGLRTVTGPGLALAVPGVRAAALDEASSADVVVGVRPEHLHLVSRSDRVSGSDRDDSWLEGVVQVVEPLGWEQHVLVDVHGQPVTARLSRATRVAIDDKVRFSVDPAAVTFFDADTDRALR